MGLFNLGSFVLGLIAWILPVVNLIKFKKGVSGNWNSLSMISVAACAISLYFQIIYSNYLAKIQDWSAIMDTSGGMVLATSVLLGVTLLLNIVTLILYRGRKNNWFG